MSLLFLRSKFSRLNFEGVLVVVVVVVVDVVVFDAVDVVVVVVSSATVKLDNERSNAGLKIIDMLLSFVDCCC